VIWPALLLIWGCTNPTGAHNAAADGGAPPVRDGEDGGQGGPSGKGGQDGGSGNMGDPGGGDMGGQGGAPNGSPSTALDPAMWIFQGAATDGTPVGGAAGTKLFTLTNTGSAPTRALGAATLGGGNADAAFRIMHDGCSGKTLVPADSCNVIVAFGPRLVGSNTTRLTVDGNTSQISGYGVGTWHAEMPLSPTLPNVGYLNSKLSWYAIRGTGPADVYVGGNEVQKTLVGNTTYVPPILHSIGDGTWNMETNSESNRFSASNSVRSFSFPDAQHLYASTDDGLILYWPYSPPGLSGRAWWTRGATIADSAVNTQTSLWAASASDVYLIVGPNLYRWNGIPGLSQIVSSISGFPAAMSSIWGTSAGDLFIVGAGGLTENWATTSLETSNTTSDLNSVWGSGPNDVWAVGAQSALIHRNTDHSWTPSPTGSLPQLPAGLTLRGGWSLSTSETFVVGDGGTILHSVDGGASWARHTQGIANVSLRAVWGTASNNVYVVGDQAAILHYY
jgi:hypothetical protein